jgi:hypothetical protein
MHRRRNGVHSRCCCCCCCCCCCTTRRCTRTLLTTAVESRVDADMMCFRRVAADKFCGRTRRRLTRTLRTVVGNREYIMVVNDTRVLREDLGCAVGCATNAKWFGSRCVAVALMRGVVSRGCQRSRDAALVKFPEGSKIAKRASVSGRNIIMTSFLRIVKTGRTLLLLSSVCPTNFRTLGRNKAF